MSEYASKLKIRILLIFAVLALGIMPAFAQVQLEIPVDDLFTSANTWMSSLSDVLAIGPGIAIAITLFSFIAGAILWGLSKSRFS